MDGLQAMRAEAMEALAAVGLSSAAQEAVLERARMGFRMERLYDADVDAAPLGASRLGGAPDVQPGWSWPAAPDGRLLGFLAQINLADATGVELETAPPSRGLLRFFYDIEDTPWGTGLEDCGLWRVEYCEASAEQLERAAFPSELEEEQRLEPVLLGLAPKLFLPSDESLAREACQLNGEPGAEAVFEALKEVVVGRRYHEAVQGVSPLEGADTQDDRFLGLPMEIQGLMPERFKEMAVDRLAEVLRNPFTGGTLERPAKKASDWPKWAREALNNTPTEDWRLLLQLSSEERRGMWCDMGKLYFWIPRNDLAAGNFEPVWMELQCY